MEWFKRWVKSSSKNKVNLVTCNEIPMRYYKVKEQKYFGLCGFDIKYDMCFIYQLSQSLVVAEGWVIESEHLVNGRLYTYVMPEGATATTEEEYLEGIKNV